MVMKNLVILGGGYGGLTIVLDLLKQGIPEDIQITLVDKNPYHSLKTEFYTIAAGTAADRDVRIDFPEDERIRYVFGEVEKIDRKSTRLNSSHLHDALPILGGGYGGLTIVLDLLKQGIPEDIQITLVDKNPYHSLKTEFYTIAAGTAADRDVRIDFPEDERIRYVFGEVEK